MAAIACHDFRVVLTSQVKRRVFFLLYVLLGVAVFMTCETKPCQKQVTVVAESLGVANGTEHSRDPMDVLNGPPSMPTTDCVEPWSMVDAMYFTITTLSTVGYGDLSPSHTGTRIFVLVYVIFGCAFVFVILAEMWSDVLHFFRQRFLLLVDKFDHTDSELSGRSAGLSGKSVDISGDGYADLVLPPRAAVYWLQELLPTLVLLLSIQLLSALVFVLVEPDLDYGSAFYHCFITASTVGYGDVQLTTDASRIWASIHITVSVSWLAALYSDFSRLRDKRERELARVRFLMMQLDEEVVLQLDHDDKGVDELEFVTGMLMMLGVELCGEPLTWADVLPFKAKFRKLDVSNTGRISREDLKELVKMSKASHLANIKKKKMAASKERKGWLRMKLSDIMEKLSLSTADALTTAKRQMAHQQLGQRLQQQQILQQQQQQQEQRVVMAAHVLKFRLQTLKKAMEAFYKARSEQKMQKIVPFDDQYLVTQQSRPSPDMMTNIW
mmetsp:Transcript_23088/g.38199  ORF Transcript_23088/g.38199 Transcript_23088/m.38199 type:complete len:497 (+) Transcript_23088:223-1713(+)